MTRLPKEGIVFHAYCPSLSADAFHETIGTANAALWPRLSRKQERYPSWTIGKIATPLSINLNPSSPWSELYVSVREHHLEEYGAEQLAELFAWLSDCTHARRGRTTGAVAPGFVRTDELDGQLEFVDWFQYWGASIVRRWGVSRLRAGPFHSVVTRADGAYVLLLAEQPDDETMSRRAAAEYLGIELRPIYAQVEAGKPVRIPWRRGGAAQRGDAADKARRTSCRRARCSRSPPPRHRL